MAYQPHVGQPVQHALAVVAGHLHPHEVRQLALLRGNDAVQGTEDGQWEASVGQAVLSAAAHVDALAGAIVVPLLQLEDQRRKPGGCGVVLVDVATEAALQGGAVVAFEARLGSMALQAQGLQLLLLSGERLGHRDDVIDLEGAHSDGSATELAHPLLPRQQLLPPTPGVLAPALQQVQEHLQAGPGEALPPIGHAQALRPLLQHLRVLAELPNHAVRSAHNPQPQRGPLAQPPHGDLGLVALRQQLRPDPAKVFRVEVPRFDLSLPQLPLLELRHGIVPLEPAEALALLGLVAGGHGPGAPVEEGVAVPGREGDGLLLLLGWLEAVQQPAPAIDVKHGGVAPHAEGPDLCGGDAPLLPVPGADGVKILHDLLQRELQKLRYLSRHAEHVLALLEGTGQDLVPSEELVADLPQSPQRLAQADLGVDPIVNDLHARGAVSPFVGWVQKVDLPRDHVDGFVRARLPQLSEHGVLDIASLQASFWRDRPISSAVTGR